jgi:hypothetical protein
MALDRLVEQSPYARFARRLALRWVPDYLCLTFSPFMHILTMWKFWREARVNVSRLLRLNFARTFHSGFSDSLPASDEALRSGIGYPDVQGTSRIPGHAMTNAQPF